MSTRIKFCGCTSWADVELAIDAGADAAGMIFAPSPRRIDWGAAEDIGTRIGTSILPVGVFVNPSMEDIERVRALFPEMAVQLSGDETPEFARAIGGTVFKAIHVNSNDTPRELEAVCDRYTGVWPMFDSASAGLFGGTGRTFDWRAIAKLARSRAVIVAGGLTPENVGSCIRMVRPAWVDVRSGIETFEQKDAQKMKRFVAAVRENDAA
jgi:phosphoribosylanthranilate isomerase